MTLALRLAGWAAWGVCSAAGNALNDFGEALIGFADEVSDAMDRREKRDKRKRRNERAFQSTLRDIESLPVQ